jgi:hypothetical protein
MCAVLNMAVFCSSLTSWFPGMVLTHFLNDFDMVPVTPIITGITLVFTFHYFILLLLLLLLLLRAKKLVKNLPLPTSGVYNVNIWSLYVQGRHYVMKK